MLHFWNGNKSSARQSYELDLLTSCLRAAGVQEPLFDDRTDRPKAEDEGNVFNQGSDVLVTVAGNEKFEDQDKIIVPHPLAKGLLGIRILLIEKSQQQHFQKHFSQKHLQSMAIGIPETWVDAELFRQNDYLVNEKGSFEQLFAFIENGEFDYSALGANEIEEIVKAQQNQYPDVGIESSLILYYPYPLLFYVNVNKPELAQHIEQGLLKLQQSGEFDQIFFKHHGDVVKRLNLHHRKVITLKNPFLPDQFKDFHSPLLAP
ncbi:hypothetical protein [Thalassotalea aquiviva]|uniref:hypothetical protein n=1 Tax=Thalassotalea aquiviva TaxID=3242415 RepID=UPI00352AA96E